MYAALQNELQLPAGFVPTCMAHPDTYLNKVTACNVLHKAEHRSSAFALCMRTAVLHTKCMVSAEMLLYLPRRQVVIGGSNGSLLLYNFTSGRLLYEFKNVNASAVKCIVSSPALDVVGVGYGDG
jgi:hypothetical protein